MTPPIVIKKTVIVGNGALGLLYADHITQQQGEQAVSFVVDTERYQKYHTQSFDCNGQTRQFNFIEPVDAFIADLVIVAVKFNGLNDTILLLRPFVGPETVIISVMNGISSEQILGQTFAPQQIIYTIAQAMDAMRFGNTLSYQHKGELRIGLTTPQQRPYFDRLVAFFEQIQLPYAIEDDILHRLWGKFMVNVGVNQTCLVYQTNYAGALQDGPAHQTMLAAMREVITLANAEGVALSEQDLDYYLQVLAGLSPEGMPSMRQDGVAKRRSEVEMFAGTVIRLAKQHQLATPANHFLYQQIKALEAAY